MIALFVFISRFQFFLIMASSSEEKLSPAPELVHDETQGYETGNIVIDKKADIGLQLLAQHEHVEYSVAEERRLRWKIDLFLLPVISVFSE